MVEPYRKLAVEAVRILENPDTIEKIAVKGYFQGLATGSIKIGQSWPINILLQERAGFDKTHYQLLENIFAAGMLSEGQVLVENYHRDSAKGR